MYQTAKKLVSMYSIIDSNNKKFVRIIQNSIAGIVKQGAGANDSMGACYFDQKSNNKCAIGVLLPTALIIKTRVYHDISSESTKPFVNHIIKSYSVDCSDQKERVRLISMLQSLQDIHDNCFDKFNIVNENRMALFLKLTNNLIMEYTK